MPTYIAWLNLNGDYRYIVAARRVGRSFEWVGIHCCDSEKTAYKIAHRVAKLVSNNNVAMLDSWNNPIWEEKVA